MLRKFKELAKGKLKERVTYHCQQQDSIAFSDTYRREVEHIQVLS